MPSQGLPPIQFERINEVRQLYLDNLDRSLDGLSAEIRKDAQASIERIKASGYKRSVAEREARKIAKRSGSITRQLVADQVRDAALYAERAFAVARAWDIAERAKLQIVPDSMAKKLSGFTTRAVAVDAEAAVARVKKARLRTPKEVDAALRKYGARSAGKQPRFRGKGPGVKAINKEIAKGTIRDSRAVGLSARLHGSAAHNIRTTEQAVGRIIREGQSLNQAGRELIEEIQKGGDTLGINQRLTAPLRRLERAGRRIRDMGVNKNDPIALREARKEWDASFRNIRKIAAGRVDSRSGYRELIQVIEQRGVKGMDRALSRWMDEKQRYNAERIVEAESSAAYRQREVDQQLDNKRVSGAFWRLNRFGSKTRKQAGRKRGRRTGGRKKKKGVQRQCVCDSLANKEYPMEVVKEYPRMGHFFCRCYWEWVYKPVDGARPLSQADMDWFEALPGKPAKAAAGPRVAAKKKPAVVPKGKVPPGPQPTVAANKRLASALGSPESGQSQRTIRNGLRSVSEKYGFKAEIAENSNQFQTYKYGKADGYYTSDGNMAIKQAHVNRARKFAAGSRQADDANSFHALIHENIHASMPTSPLSYSGNGMIAEEVATEVGARGVMAREYGLKWNQFKGYSDVIEEAVSQTQRAINASGVRITKDEAFDVLFKASQDLTGAQNIFTPGDMAGALNRRIKKRAIEAAKRAGAKSTAETAREASGALEKWIKSFS